MRRLLIRPGAIGDFILSLPALQSLCEGDTEIWASARNVTLVRFARARAISSTGLELLGIPDIDPPESLIEVLRGFDSIVSWYGSNRPEFRRAVEQLELPFLFFPALPPAGGRIHAADFYMDQAATLTGRRSPAVPELRCGCPGENWVAIHPFSGSPKKNWPLERYIEAARALTAEWRAKWILEPGSEPPPVAEPEPQTDDLFELACRLSSARLYIGNDSGITHLAAAAGAPVLALFGPTDPDIWGPRGRSTVRILKSPAPHGEMNGISLDEVLGAAAELLGKGAERQAEG